MTKNIRPKGKKRELQEKWNISAGRRDSYSEEVWCPGRFWYLRGEGHPLVHIWRGFISMGSCSPHLFLGAEDWEHMFQDSVWSPDWIKNLCPIQVCLWNTSWQLRTPWTTLQEGTWGGLVFTQRETWSSRDHLPPLTYPALEPPGLSRSDGKRHDGLSPFTWKEGKYLVWDFTTSCTVAPSNISTSVQGAGKTAEAREKSKCAKYSSLGDSYHFVPLSTETFGAMEPRTKRFIDDLEKQLIEYSGERRAKFYLQCEERMEQPSF